MRRRGGAGGGAAGGAGGSAGAAAVGGSSGLSGASGGKGGAAGAAGSGGGMGGAMGGTGGAVPADPKSKNWVYLMLGQSNMSGQAHRQAEDVVAVPRVFKLTRNKMWVAGHESFNISEYSSRPRSPNLCCRAIHPRSTYARWWRGTLTDCFASSKTAPAIRRTLIFTTRRCCIQPIWRGCCGGR